MAYVILMLEDWSEGLFGRTPKNTWSKFSEDWIKYASLGVAIQNLKKLPKCTRHYVIKKLPEIKTKYIITTDGIYNYNGEKGWVTTIPQIFNRLSTAESFLIEAIEVAEHDLCSKEFIKSIHIKEIKIQE